MRLVFTKLNSLIVQTPKTPVTINATDTVRDGKKIDTSFAVDDRKLLS
jgi:hypothetical protein